MLAVPRGEGPRRENPGAEHHLTHRRSELLELGRFAVGKRPPGLEGERVREILDLRSYLKACGGERAGLVEQPPLSQPVRRSRPLFLSPAAQPSRELRGEADLAYGCG